MIGFFSRISINELQGLGRRLYPRLLSREISEDIKSLTKLMENIVKREPGEDIQNAIQGRNLSLCIMFIAQSPSTMDGDGYDSYS